MQMHEAVLTPSLMHILETSTPSDLKPSTKKPPRSSSPTQSTMPVERPSRLACIRKLEAPPNCLVIPSPTTESSFPAGKRGTGITMSTTESPTVTTSRGISLPPRVLDELQGHVLEVQVALLLDLPHHLRREGAYPPEGSGDAAYHGSYGVRVASQV